jgi:hypothetical protein
MDLVIGLMMDICKVQIVCSCKLHYMILGVIYVWYDFFQSTNPPIFGKSYLSCFLSKFNILKCNTNTNRRITNHLKTLRSNDIVIN